MKNAIARVFVVLGAGFLVFGCAPEFLSAPVDVGPPDAFRPRIPIESITIEKSSHFARSRDTLYRCSRYDGIEIIDLSKGPSSVVASYNTSGFCVHLAASENLLFVSNGNDFLVLDIGDPLSPRELGRVALSAYAAWFAVDRGHAYISNYAWNLVAIDIRNPAKPLKVWESELYGDHWHPSVDGRGYLYMNDTGMGFRVFDLSNPAVPKEIVQKKPQSSCQVLSSARLGRFFYVADSHNGVHVYDFVTNDAPPSEWIQSATAIQHVPVLNSEKGGFAHYLTIVGDELFLAEGSCGLRVFRIGANGALTPTFAQDTQCNGKDLVEVYPLGRQVLLYYGNQEVGVVALPE